MITALLIVIVVLLIGVLALMLTGWPGRERKEIEKTGRELRRELAQHRADSVQLLHAMRMELEESVRETLELEFASFEKLNQRASSRNKKSPAAQQLKSSKHEEEENESGEGLDDFSMKRSRGSRFQQLESGRQFPLFQETKQKEETIYIASDMLLDDDIPDIEHDLPDDEV
jgi:competence protein ComGC